MSLSSILSPMLTVNPFYQRSIKIKDKQQLITVVPVKKTAAGFACKGCLIYPTIIIGTEMFF